MANNDRIPDPTEAAKNLFGSILKEGKTLADEVSGNAKAVAKSALGNLDVVSRDEFDAQKNSAATNPSSGGAARSRNRNTPDEARRIRKK
jgi:BMFP domain-containing protein YqiC